MEMEKVDDPMVPNGWIVQLFHFHFPFSVTKSGIHTQPKEFKSADQKIKNIEVIIRQIKE